MIARYYLTSNVEAAHEPRYHFDKGEIPLHNYY